MVVSARGNADKPYGIGIPEHKLLCALTRYDYLTAEQATRLLFSEGSVKYVMARLAQLARNEYVLPLFVPGLTPRGRPKTVYTLAHNGRRYVLEEGIALAKRIRPDEEYQKARNPFFMRHTLAVIDVLIAAELLSQTMPGVVLNRMFHERQLKRDPIYVDLPSDGGKRKHKTVCIVPDCSLDFTIQQTWQDFIHTEVFRSLPEEKDWKQKVHAYVVYANSLHEQRFGTPALTIAVVSIIGERVRNTLLTWTEEELTRLQAEQEGERFFFSSLAISEASPLETFIAPYWYQAFGTTPTPLLLLEDTVP
jgi:hypothetical protein